MKSRTCALIAAMTVAGVLAGTHVTAQSPPKPATKQAAKNAEPTIFHIEGDPDHPVNRGTLCPKGAGLADIIHSKSRLLYPEYRAPGSNEWKRLSWDDALDRIARLMKEDRDANFVQKNEAGQTVNRWLTTGMLAASATSNETAVLTHKVVRSLGMLAFDNQARV